MGEGMSKGQRAVWFSLGDMLLKVGELPVIEREQMISDLADYFIELEADRTSD